MVGGGVGLWEGLVENEVADPWAMAPLGELWMVLSPTPDALVTIDSLLVLLVSFPPLPLFVTAPASPLAGEGVEVVEGVLDCTPLPPLFRSTESVDGLERVPAALLDPPEDEASRTAPPAAAAGAVVVEGVAACP